MIESTRLDTSIKAILGVAIPMSLGAFVQFIVSFTDNYFVAQIDEFAMSGAAFVGLIYITLAMIGYGLGNAVQILVARRNGENQPMLAGRITSNALLLGIFIAIFQFALLRFVTPSLLEVLIDSDQARYYMNEFLRYRSFGFFFYTLTLILHSFWSGIAHTKVMIYTTSITALVNIGLDYCLVFGEFGLPEMGVAGAALATVISEAAAFVFLLIYTFRSTANGDYGVFRQLLLPLKESHFWADTKSLFKLGLPIIFQMVLSLLIWVIFYNLIEKLDGKSFQSSFIIRNMYSLVWVSIMGFSTTAKTYISGLIAEKRLNELWPTARKLMLLNLCGVFILSHGLWLYPEWITMQFTDDPEVIQLTVQSMYIILPAMYTFAFTSVLLGTVEGSGNTVAGFIVELATTVFYLITAYSLTIVWPQPVYIVWMSDYVYFIFLGIFSLFYLRNDKWKNKVI